jgi:hypothetical protein
MKHNIFAHILWIALALLVLPLSWSVSAVLACAYLAVEGTIFLLKRITAVPRKAETK